MRKILLLCILYWVGVRGIVKVTYKCTNENFENYTITSVQTKAVKRTCTGGYVESLTVDPKNATKVQLLNEDESLLVEMKTSNLQKSDNSKRFNMFIITPMPGYTWDATCGEDYTRIESSDKSPPFECRLCASSSTAASKYNHNTAQVYYTRTYISCPKTDTDLTTGSCPAGKWKLTPDQNRERAASLQECNRFRMCDTNEFRDELVCKQCPTTVGNQGKSEHAFRYACACRAGYEHGERECLLCEPGKFQATVGTNKTCQSCAGRAHDTTYGSTTCEETCENQIRFAGQCVAYPTTIQELDALIEYGILTWRGQEKDDYALNESTPAAGEYVEDFILDPTPGCARDQIVDSVHGRCQRCTDSDAIASTVQSLPHRDKAATCAALVCHPYGVLNTTTKTCVNDTALLDILANNVSHFCYPVASANSSNLTVCATCRTSGFDIKSETKHINTLTAHDVGSVTTEAAPCKYTCAPGYEPSGTLGQGWVAVQHRPAYATLLQNDSLTRDLAGFAGNTTAEISGAVDGVEWRHYVDTGGGRFWRPVGLGCVACLPGFFKASAGDEACAPCPAGQRSANFSGSEECVTCESGKYSRAHGQHACLPCYDNDQPDMNQTWHVVAPRNAIDNATPADIDATLLRHSLAVGALSANLSGMVAEVDGVWFRADASPPCDPSRDFLLPMEETCGAGGSTGPNCAACATLQPADAFHTDCPTECPGLRFENGTKLALPEHYCKSTAPDDACGEGRYADEDNVCRVCAEHTCDAHDEFLVSGSCPPQCESCHKYLEDGEILAPSPRDDASCAVSDLCARGFVVQRFLQPYLRNQLNTSRKCIPLRMTNLVEIVDGTLRCARDDTEELKVASGGIVYCETRPNPCPSDNFVEYDGVCQCLPDSYRERDVCHLCPLDRIAPRGSEGPEACVCRPGFLSGDGDACTACPSGARYYCPGNDMTAACPDNTTTQRSEAFAAHHCEPDASFVRNPVSGMIEQCDSSAEGSALSTFWSGCTRTCAVGAVLRAEGCRCDLEAGFYFDEPGRDCKCRAGWFRADDTCVLCTRGAYCVGGDLQRRELCTDVLATTEVGAKHIDNCTCPLGFYEVEGSRQCLACPVNYVCSENQKHDCPSNRKTNVQFFCRSRRLSVPLICPRGSLVRSRLQDQDVCENVDDPDVCTAEDGCKDGNDDLKLLLGIAQYDARGSFVQMLYYSHEYSNFAIHYNFYEAIVGEKVRKRYFTSALQTHITVLGTLHSRCLFGEALVLASTHPTDLFMGGNGSLTCASIVSEAHAGLLGPMQYPSPGTAPLGPSGRGDPVRLPQDKFALDLQKPESHVLWTPRADCTGAAFLPACCEQHDDALEFVRSVRERFASDMPAVAYVALDAATQWVWGAESLPFHEGGELCASGSEQELALAILLRETVAPTRAALAGMQTLLDARACVQVGPVAYRPGDWAADRVHLLDRGAADPGGSVRPAPASAALSALLAQRRPLTATELATHAPDLREGDAVFDPTTARYFVRRTEQRARVPQEAVAMLEPGTGRLVWELYASSGALARRIVAPHVSGTSLAFAVALPTWAFATVPELLPALVAGVCDDSKHGENLQLVFCPQHQGSEGACRVALASGDADELCAARTRGAAFVDLYNNSVRVHLHLPTEKAYKVALTDNRATPTHTPTLAVTTLHVAHPAWRSVFAQPFWSEEKPRIMDNLCEFTLVRTSGNEISLYSTEAKIWANASKTHIVENITATLRERHERTLPATAFQDLECVDMALRDTRKLILPCAVRIAVMLLCRADHESREWLVVGGEADFAAETLSGVRLLATRVLPPFVEGEPRIALRHEPVAQNDTYPNILHTRVHVELYYMTKDQHIMLHRERFAATCDAQVGANADRCEQGHLRVCVPCNDSFCEAQALTWNTSASRCVVPRDVASVDRFAVRCVPCTGGVACPDDTTIEPCESHAYVHEPAVVSNLSCACQVDNTFLPRQSMVLGNPRRVDFTNSGVRRCEPCGDNEICHPMLLRTGLRCPDGTRLQDWEVDSSNYVHTYQFRCTCDAHQGLQIVPDRDPVATLFEPDDPTPMDVRQWDWSQYPRLFENARYNVTVEICRHATTMPSHPSAAGLYGGNPCPMNFYCPQDRPGPIPCPPNMITETDGKASRADCVCVDGMHKNVDVCELCPPGFSCQGGTKQGCNAAVSLDRSRCLDTDEREPCNADELRNTSQGVQDKINATASLWLEVLDAHPFAAGDRAVLLHWNSTALSHECVPELHGTSLSNERLDGGLGGFGVYLKTAIPCPVPQNETRLVLSLAGCAQTATQWRVRGELEQLLRFAWPGIILFDVRTRLSPTLNRALRDARAVARHLHFATEPLPIVQALQTRGLFVMYGNIDMLQSTRHRKPDTVLAAVLEPALAWHRAASEVLSPDPVATPIVVAGSFLYTPALHAAATSIAGGQVPIFFAAEAAAGMSLDRAHIWHARRDESTLLLVSPLLLKTEPVRVLAPDRISAALPRLVLEQDVSRTCPPGLTDAGGGTGVCTRCARGKLRAGCDKCGKYLDGSLCEDGKRMVQCLMDGIIICGP